MFIYALESSHEGQTHPPHTPIPHMGFSPAQTCVYMCTMCVWWGDKLYIIHRIVEHGNYVLNNVSCVFIILVFVMVMWPWRLRPPSLMEWSRGTTMDTEASVVGVMTWSARNRMRKILCCLFCHRILQYGNIIIRRIRLFVKHTVYVTFKKKKKSSARYLFVVCFYMFWVCGMNVQNDGYVTGFAPGPAVMDQCNEESSVYCSMTLWSQFSLTRTHSIYISVTRFRC